MFNLFKKQESTGAAAPDFNALVRQLDQALLTQFHKRCVSRGLDLTPEQCWVLSRLRERDGRTQNELAQAGSKDRPTMSRISALLERRGFLTRKSHETDGRSQRLWLTAKGRDRASLADDVDSGLRRDMLKGLRSQELAAALEVLRRLLENLTQGA